MKTLCKLNFVLLFLFLQICNVGCSSKEAQKDQLTEKERTSVKAAIKELNKLGSSTEAGLDYKSYQTRVLDTKAVVDDLMLEIPDGEIKTALNDSLTAYVDAYKYWGIALNRASSKSSFFKFKKTEIEEWKKYFGQTDFAKEGSAAYGMGSTEMVPVFWLYAGGGVVIAEKKLSGEWK